MGRWFTAAPEVVPSRAEGRSVVQLHAAVGEVWSWTLEPGSQLTDPTVVHADWLGPNRGVGGIQVIVRREAGGVVVDALEITHLTEPWSASYRSATVDGLTCPSGGSVQITPTGTGTRLVQTFWAQPLPGARAAEVAALSTRLQMAADKATGDLLRRFGGGPAS